MSEGLNRVTLLGNVGQDPEMRTTSSGSPVLKLRIATSERYKDRSQTWQDRTEWHSVVVWGKRAEALGRLIEKGTRLLVEGRLCTRTYEARDGSGKRYSTEVVATNVLFAGGRQERKQRTEPSEHEQQKMDGYQDDWGGADDGIPF